MSPSQSLSCLALTGLLVLPCGIMGCQPSPTPVSTDTAPDTVAASPTDVSSPQEMSPANPTAERRQDEVWVDQQGRRFIGRVPYDVFFDEPLTVAVEGADTQRPSAVTETMGRVPTTTQPAGDAQPLSSTPLSAAEATPSGGWESWLPAEVLESEVKSARNFLNQKLQSVGNYNSSITMIPLRAGTIAILAAIAMEHDGDISWQADAGYVRDLAAQMSSGQLKRGPSDQRRLLELFENMSDTLNRSRPSGLPEPAADLEWSEAGPMGLVMRRLEEAESTLRTEVTESGFAAAPELVQHEASLLTGLMKAMTTESYGFADDPDFLSHAQIVMESGQSMRDSVVAGEYAAYELSLTKTAGACQACHRDYKNN